MFHFVVKYLKYMELFYTQEERAVLFVIQSNYGNLMT